MVWKFAVHRKDPLKCSPEEKNEAEDNEDQNDDDNYENADSNDEKSDTF